jgi:TonB family protein
MFRSIRTLVPLFITAIMAVSACSSGAQKRPPYFDSDFPGNKAKRAEFPGCAPPTETNPILLNGNLPEYPRREAQVGTIGSVDVQFVVTQTGTTTNIETLRATSRRYSTNSNNRFGEEVNTAIGNWIFEPAMSQSTAVAVVCWQRVVFNEAGVTIIPGETRLIPSPEN